MVGDGSTTLTTALAAFGWCCHQPKDFYKNPRREICVGFLFIFVTSMKKKILLNCISLSVLLVVMSCDNKTPKHDGRNEEKVNPDSALYHYVLKIFHHIPNGNTLDNFLQEQRTPHKEIIIYPRKYKLRSYSWGDGQTYRPFAVEVKDSNGKVIDYFAFADEKFYMNKYDTVNVPHRNSIPNEKVSLKKDRNVRKSDSSFLTLSKEINKLINILGYNNNEHAIRILIDAMFNDLLRFQKLNSSHGMIDFQIERYKRINKNHILDSTIKELELLQGISFEPWPFIFKCREGSEGYWVLYVRKKPNESFYIEPKFFGSQLYWNMYW